MSLEVGKVHQWTSVKEVCITCGNEIEHQVLCAIGCAEDGTPHRRSLIVTLENTSKIIRIRQEPPDAAG